MDRLSTLLATATERSCSVAGDFLGLLLDVRTWRCAEAKTQCEVVVRAEDFLTSSPHTFCPHRVLRMLMDAMENYVELGAEECKETVERLWTLTSEYAGANLSAKVVSIITGYLNLNYMRRLSNYPILLFRVLSLVLKIYVESKEKMVEMIKKLAKTKKNCDLLVNVLIILEYFSYQLKEYAECENKESKEVDYISTDNGTAFQKEDRTFLRHYNQNFELIDKIIGICLYLATDFDWSIFGNPIKELIKEEVKTPKQSPASQSKLSTSSSVEPRLKSTLLRTIFTNKVVLGLTSYKALVSAAFNTPNELWSLLELKGALRAPIDGSKAISAHSALEFILQHAHLFAPSATKPLLNDITTLLETHSYSLNKYSAKLLKENAEETVLIQSVLGLNLAKENFELETLQANLIHSLITPVQPHWCCYLSGTALHKLSVIDKALDLAIENYVPITDKQVSTALMCIDFTYALEDVLELHFIKEKLYEFFVTALCKLIILLDKGDLLYISLPPWTFLEQREREKEVKRAAGQEREGGILRILFKSILICIKKCKTRISVDLLRYVLFRDKAIKHRIEEYIGIATSEEKNKFKPSIVDIMFNKNPDAIKHNEAINQFYLKKVIPKYSGTLSQKIAGDIDYFESPLTVALHILVSLSQLVYFELLGAESWAEVTRDSAALKAIAKSYKRLERKLPELCVELLGLLGEVFGGNRHATMVQMITADFYELLESSKSKFNSNALKVTLETVYSSLDTQRSVVKEEEETKADPSILEEELANFLRNWIRFTSALLNISRVDNLGEIQKDTIKTLLNAQNLLAVQPMALLITLHPFHKIDSWVQSPFIHEANETNKELQENLRNLFAKVGIPKGKLKRDIVSAYFDIVGRAAYKELVREQKLEFGCWVNKSRRDYERSLFTYVKRKYEKVECNRTPFNEFVRLSKQRDGLNRSLIVKKFKEVEKSSLNGYGYIRSFILKKMLVKSLCKENGKFEGYYEDFKYKLVRRLFNPKSEQSKNIVRKALYSEGIADEYIPVNMRLCDVDLVTVEGHLPGKLGAYKDFLLFHSTQPSKRVIKIWDTSTVQEVIMGRGIEIYFASTSVLLSFPSPGSLQDFADSLRKAVEGVKVEWVQNSEDYFTERQFSSLWASGALTNFEYLMLLNKYSGKSFNDLEQYPVFPKIIQDFETKHRLLNVDIMSLNLEGMSKNIDAESSKEAIGKAADLASGAVLGHLALIEPYSSLLDKYGWKICKNERLLQSFARSWGDCAISLDEGERLLPEFFYLPEAFSSRNLRLLGVPAEENFSPLSPLAAAVSIGTKDHHKFIRRNARCLESKKVSFELNKWIDATFGERQEDNKEWHKVEINSFRLFSAKHPSKDPKKFREKTQCAVFSTCRKSQDIQVAYTLQNVKSIDTSQAVVFLASSERKIITVLSNQRLYQTKETYANSFNDKVQQFEKKEIGLFPFEPISSTLHDTQRHFALHPSTGSIITCRHYDCTFKFTDHSTGLIKNSIKFHTSPVTCVLTTESAIFTTSNDGVVAKWSVGFAHPVWSALSHESAVASVDACEQLNLVATAAAEEVVLRESAGGKLVRVVKAVDGAKTCVSHVRLSFRGYFVAVGKSKKSEHDWICTFSVNGEEIARKNVGMSINVIVMSEDGYEFIVGGNSGNLRKFALLSLKEETLFDSMDKMHKATNSAVVEFTNSSPHITAMALTPLEGCQQLVLGTNTGMFYVYRYSPRLIDNGF